MLSKLNRLRKEKDIERVLRTGRGLKIGQLLLKSAKNDLGESRFAFLVSKRVSKKAILRNKIRRRLREAVRREIANLKPGNDSLIIVLPGGAEKEAKELNESLNQLFLKAKLYK